MRVNEYLHVICFILNSDNLRCLISTLNAIELEDNMKLKEEVTALAYGPLVKSA